MKIPLYFLIIFCLFSCTKSNRNIDKTIQENIIREIVYRDQIEKCQKFPGGNFFYLALAALKDSMHTYNDSFSSPSNDVMIRFKSDSAFVKPFSDSSKSAYSLFNRFSKQFELVIWTSSITWNNKNKVHIPAGYESESYSSAIGYYILEYKLGKWTITKWVTTGFSL